MRVVVATRFLAISSVATRIVATWARATAKFVTAKFVAAKFIASLFVASIIAASLFVTSAIGAEHWAYQRPERRPLPAVVDRTSVRNPVDLWILAALERERLTPSPAADPETLLRRVTFDLTGLPPTVDEQSEFLADRGPDAYDRAVDRLLASPRYGERWARPWLDLAHFADTDGYLTDQPRPVAWRYRQWLIEALNRDLPFDQFTVWQLAGDLLPDAKLDQRLATGFLRNTLSNREGGADLEEFRVEQIVDRTQLVGATWLGMTIGCARCHDHKFDPVTQREFFGLYAFLDSADEVNVDAPLPGEQAAYDARRAEYLERRAALLAPRAEERTALQRRWEARLLEAERNPGQDHVWDRQWEVLGLIWGGRLGEGQLEGTQIVRLDPARRSPDQESRILDYFLQHGSVIAPEPFRELKLGELSGQLKKLADEYPKLSRAPAMSESVIPRATTVHVRGDFRVPGESVTPHVPACLPGLGAEASEVRESSAGNAAPSTRNRLTLARWLVAPEHPLTARVTVNRQWQELFGRGIVATSDDFGVQGERPTHPELLDWLACELPARDWSVKSLQRLIVSSATYRQSARVDTETFARDPRNKWLARQSAVRFSADQVRDALLAASGLLSSRVGGPSVFPPQPASVAAEAFDNQWPESQGEGRYRRSLYTYLQRLSPYAQFVTFDAPSLAKACTRRERSNTPLQALTLLNDPVFMEGARHLAGRTLAEAPAADSASRIAYLFRRALGRAPRPEETSRLQALLARQTFELARDVEQCREFAPLYGGVTRVAQPEGKSAAESAARAETDSSAAAWTIVASVVLNLHEFITR